MSLDSLATAHPSAPVAPGYFVSTQLPQGRPANAGTLLSSVHRLHDKGDIQGAMVRVREILDKYPDFPEANQNLALYCFEYALSTPRARWIMVSAGPATRNAASSTT